MIDYTMNTPPHIKIPNISSINNVLIVSLLVSFFVILNRSPLSFVFGEHSVYMGYFFICIGFYILITAILVRSNIPKFNRIDRAVLCYLLFLSLRALCMPDIRRSIVGLALYTGAVPVYCIVRAVRIKSGSLISVVFFAFIYLVSSTLIETAFGIQLGTTRVHVSRLSFFPHRLASTLGSSNHLSIFLPALCILLTAHLLNQKNRRSRAYALGVNFVSLFLVIGTSSRGGIIAYVVSLTLLWFFQKVYVENKRVSNIIAVSICIFVLLLLWFFCPQKSQLYSFLSSIFDPNEVGNSIRLIKYRAIINSVLSDLQTLLFGVGLGYMGNVVHLAGLPTYFELKGIGEYYGSESWLLKMLFETGLCGFVLFYRLLLRSVYYSHVFTLRSADRVERGIYLGILFCLILFLLRSFILQVFDIPIVLLFTWGGMGYLSRALSREHLGGKTLVRSSSYV